MCCRLALLISILLLAACGGESGGRGSSGTGGPNVTTTPAGSFKAANASSIYANVLVNCVDIENQSQSCPLSTLPLLGQQSSSPSIQQIMDRLVVTDTWMATRFEQLLQRYPLEIRLLLRSVTAIVIGRDIRPSFYTSTTGAIYLDPANLWLTLSEKEVISTVPDYRSGFDDELGFVSLWRYVNNNQYAWYSTSAATSRTLDEIELPMASLLFHELAHAADFFPPARISSLSVGLSIYQNAVTTSGSRLSNQLKTDYPLNSPLMYALGQVMFYGTAATTVQKLLQPAAVAQEFSLDRANDDYAYASQFEDLAMLFEEAMMKRQYNIDRDIGYTNRPPSDAPRSAYVLEWGMRNRVADPTVVPRTRLVLSSVLNLPDVDSYIASLGSAESLASGISWDNSIFLSAQKPSTDNNWLKSLPPSESEMSLPLRPYSLFEDRLP